MKSIIFCCLLFVVQHALFAQNFDGGFSFFLPYYDSSAQEFLPEFPAYTIEEAHRVSTGPGGQFYAGGESVRFWGVNIVAAACFPEKDKAPAIAARMRKMGINLVRFHHLDNPSWGGANSSIFLNGQNGTRQLNPVTLDRLDYFIAQLKRNGIYVNMNLNVSRTFQEADGVPGADSLPDFGKGVTLFDPWMQFLQKEYAEQLMGHVNPYTNLPLAADLGMGVVVNRPFRQGRLTEWLEGRPLPEWAGEIGASSWAQFILKFILSHPAVTVVIPATTRPDHARENVAASAGPLPDRAMRERMSDHVRAL